MNFIERVLHTQITPGATRRLETALVDLEKDRTDKRNQLDTIASQIREKTALRDTFVRQANSELRLLENSRNGTSSLASDAATALAQKKKELENLIAAEALKTAHSAAWSAYSFEGVPLDIIDTNKRIEVTPQVVKFTTQEFGMYEPISGCSTEKLFGPLNITIHVKNSCIGKTLEVFVLPIRGKNRYQGECVHPHVSSSNIACLGEFGTTMLQHMVNNLQPAAIGEMCRFLCHYNPLSPHAPLASYVKVHPWNTPHCPVCKLPAMNCQCVKQTRIRCVHCLRTTSLTSCGSCVYCCSTKHKTNLTTTSGFAGTTCVSQ